MAEFSAFWNGTVTGDATSAPYDANTEFANWVKRGFGVGANRANAGVVLGTGSESTQLDALQVTQNSPAGMSVLLNIGAAQVDGTEYYNDSALTLSIAANGSGLARIDTIILRKSFASQTVRAAVLQGTPAGTPVPPTLTQSAGVTWDIAIADIAVANGAVSITNANITSRASYTDGADGVYLDRILNSTVDTNVTGDAVKWGPARSSIVAGRVNMAVPAGVWSGRTASAANGRMISRGIGYVATLGGATVGQYGHLSTTARRVLPTDNIRMNSFCRFLETTSGTGLALAFIDAGIHPLFGSIRGTTLSVAGAALAITSIPAIQQSVTGSSETGTLIVEIMARSAVAATTDFVNLRLGGAVLDTTAANYYSYTNFIANSTPAVTAVQNLGATGAIQFTIVGNNAPANVYTHAIIQIGFAFSTTLNKIITGTGFSATGTTNGTLFNMHIGGRWVNAVEAIEQLSLVSNGGSNLAAGSYMNVYYKDVA